MSMDTEQGSWGGRRAGAGRKSAWKSGPCKAVKIPALLVDQVLKLARQLDEGGGSPFPFSLVPPLAAARGDEDLARLRAQNHELLQRLDEVIAERDRLAAELEALRSPVLAVALGPPLEATSHPPANAAIRPAPAWLSIVTKQILGLPKRTTCLMVLSLLFNHQSYVAERLQDLARRPPAPGASPRLREEWETRRKASSERMQDLEQLFAALPQELIEEARGLRVNWGTRTASGAKRSYKALLARMGSV